MLKKIFSVLLILVVLFVIGGFVLPSDYAVAHSVEIDAPPAKVHSLVGDLKRWDDWGPWKETDPTVEVTLGEQTTGVGARQSWTSKDGPGALTFTKTDPATGVAYDMEIGDYPPAKGALSYEVVDGGKTKVTWSMQGDMTTPVIGPYFAMLMNTFTGPMFKSGLAKLKVKAEAK